MKNEIIVLSFILFLMSINATDNTIGEIGLISVVLGWLFLSKVRRNNVLEAGSISLVIGFVMYILFLATAEGDYGEIWLIFAKS